MNGDSQSEAARLHQPVARLLRPLVRLLIRRGITFPLLCEMMRELYVNVAEHDFALDGKPQTDSRVSLLTGVHRKEVRRLRGAGAPVNAVPVGLSRASRIVARWLGGPPFTDGAGRPLPLSRTGEGGASFEALVASVTRDLRPRAVLDEWLSRKLVVVDAEGRIALAEEGLVPKAGDEQQLHYFGRNLHDHLSAAVSNVIGEAPPFLERAVHYDGLSEHAAERLRLASREMALSTLQAANREAQAVCDQPGAEGRWRWTLGVYIYAEPGRASAPPDGEADPS